MGAKRATRWWWSDWMGDLGLRKASLAARGLWIDMLAIMSSEEPIGYLTDGGQPMSDIQLSRLVGSTPAEVRTLLDELDRLHIFSRTKGGLLYCRRIVRDEINARKNRDNGKKGGNPALLTKRSSARGNPPPDNPPDNDRLKRAPGIPLLKKERIPPPSSSTTPAPAPAEGPPGGGGGSSDEGGGVAPQADALLAQVESLVAGIHGQDRRRHRGDLAVVEGWLAAGIEAHQALTAVSAVAGAEAEKGHAQPTSLGFYDRAVRDGRQPAPPKPDADPSVALVDAELSRWRARVHGWQRRGMWLAEHWGPAPDQPGTWVPASVRAELGVAA